jgi:hypothetical protein
MGYGRKSNIQTGNINLQKSNICRKIEEKSFSGYILPLNINKC